MKTNVFHTITRLIILISLQSHGDWAEKARERERERFSEISEMVKETRKRWKEGGREEGRKKGERIRLRDLQWLYISQCLVKAAWQGSGNLIIA